MKKLLYNPNTLNLIQLIKKQKLQEILFDNCFYIVFMFDTFYITAQPRSFQADSQNEFDEAITLEFSLHQLPYISSGMISLCQNTVVEKIWIMRTLLYFTAFRVFETKEEAIAGLPEPTTDFQKTFYEAISKSTGGYNEVITSPVSKEAETVNNTFANLVDKGIIFQTYDKQIFRCYAPENAYFSKCQRIEHDILEKEILPFYELIELI